jgi:hypothetical protein
MVDDCIFPLPFIQAESVPPSYIALPGTFQEPLNESRWRDDGFAEWDARNAAIANG